MEPPAPNPGHGAGRPMATRPAPCTVRSPVALQVGDVKTDLSRPGVAVIDVALPPAQPLDLQEIVFKNSYTAFLTVRVQRRRPCDVGRASARKWVTCLWNHCLMPRPHTEAGSQDYFSLFRHQLLCDVDQVTAVRLILRQPSPVWLHFTLEELRLYPRGQQSLQTDFPSWLSHLAPQQQPENLHGGVPDPEKVSTEVQQLWVLTEMIRANQTAARIGRFDVSFQLALFIAHRGWPPALGLLCGPACAEGAGCILGTGSICSHPELLPAGHAVRNAIKLLGKLLRVPGSGVLEVDGCYDINLLSYT